MPDSHDKNLAVKIPNLGDAGIEAGKVEPKARIAFENGVRLNNGFAEEEAGRAFRLAERLDPTCAMCYWGEAAALAPPSTTRSVTNKPHEQLIFSAIEHIERGKVTGEFVTDVDPAILIDMIFGPVFYRHLLRLARITQEYGRQLVDQGLLAVRKSTHKQSETKSRKKETRK